MDNADMKEVHGSIFELCKSIRPKRGAEEAYNSMVKFCERVFPSKKAWTGIAAAGVVAVVVCTVSLGVIATLMVMHRNDRLERVETAGEENVFTEERPAQHSDRKVVLGRRKVALLVSLVFLVAMAGAFALIWAGTDFFAGGSESGLGEDAAIGIKGEKRFVTPPGMFGSLFADANQCFMGKVHSSAEFVPLEEQRLLVSAHSKDPRYTSVSAFLDGYFRLRVRMRCQGVISEMPEVKEFRSLFPILLIKHREGTMEIADIQEFGKRVGMKNYDLLEVRAAMESALKATDALYSVASELTESEVEKITNYIGANYETFLLQALSRDRPFHRPSILKVRPPSGLQLRDAFTRAEYEVENLVKEALSHKTLAELMLKPSFYLPFNELENAANGTLYQH